MSARILIAPALAAVLVLAPRTGTAGGIDPAAVATAAQSVVVVLPNWQGVRAGFAPKSADGRITPEASGVAVLPGGYVATNDHVLGDAVSVRIRLADGRTVSAEIVGRHKATDIALLKAPIDLPVAEPGPEPTLAEPVCAIGNPFGRGISVSCGVVSGTGRANAGFNVIEDFIQTDAAVNPGGSGGALVDGKGRLVGLVSAIFAQGSDANIGVNFAASQPLMARVVGDLAAHGTVMEATAGMETGALSAQQQERTGGVAVVEVARGGPAFAAGIDAGDVITKIDGRPVTSPGQFRAALFRHHAGDAVALTVRRGGADRQISLTLQARP
ncbi:trypsin-like peptidase domain-containing protein [Thalassospiraceae bacterium LMO-SO8]|nr:trypsin-like peptidase domain-containing protein [Alphaproteobacteria bacterium LMO-S08]WND77787.1 trypsin-like peptidase domain-containing protein [Thalassospiraceae bacterium LMO-SO8]